ncbi:hypothetical protein CAOG_05507 [Capsaspora owczarzaki ATCC 30864]|nr:hypothetical protein CAOG_05507 [Capsaspora owczarzaki ATCC 30864]|eukprot:XP_004346180.2 hypothetical protein CAOG_05507 [Capsaspora owczarzaki ATCC 30864]
MAAIGNGRRSALPLLLPPGQDWTATPPRELLMRAWGEQWPPERWGAITAEQLKRGLANRDALASLLVRHLEFACRPSPLMLSYLRYALGSSIVSPLQLVFMISDSPLSDNRSLFHALSEVAVESLLQLRSDVITTTASQSQKSMLAAYTSLSAVLSSNGAGLPAASTGDNPTQFAKATLRLLSWLVEALQAYLFRLVGESDQRKQHILSAEEKRELQASLQRAIEQCLRILRDPVASGLLLCARLEYCDSWNQLCSVLRAIQDQCRNDKASMLGDHSASVWQSFWPSLDLVMHPTWYQLKQPPLLETLLNVSRQRLIESLSTSSSASGDNKQKSGGPVPASDDMMTSIEMPFSTYMATSLLEEGSLSAPRLPNQNICSLVYRLHGSALLHASYQEIAIEWHGVLASLGWPADTFYFEALRTGLALFSNASSSSSHTSHTRYSQKLVAFVQIPRVIAAIEQDWVDIPSELFSLDPKQPSRGYQNPLMSAFTQLATVYSFDDWFQSNLGFSALETLSHTLCGLGLLDPQEVSSKFPTLAHPPQSESAEVFLSQIRDGQNGSALSWPSTQEEIDHLFAAILSATEEAPEFATAILRTLCQQARFWPIAVTELLADLVLRVTLSLQEHNPKLLEASLPAFSSVDLSTALIAAGRFSELVSSIVRLNDSLALQNNFEWLPMFDVSLCLLANWELRYLVTTCPNLQDQPSFFAQWSRHWWDRISPPEVEDLVLERCLEAVFIEHRSDALSQALESSTFAEVTLNLAPRLLREATAAVAAGALSFEQLRKGLVVLMSAIPSCLLGPSLVLMQDARDSIGGEAKTRWRTSHFEDTSLSVAVLLEVMLIVFVGPEVHHSEHIHDDFDMAGMVHADATTLNPTLVPLRPHFATLALPLSYEFCKCRAVLRSTRSFEPLWRPVVSVCEVLPIVLPQHKSSMTTTADEVLRQMRASIASCDAVSRLFIDTLRQHHRLVGARNFLSALLKEAFAVREIAYVAPSVDVFVSSCLAVDDIQQIAQVFFGQIVVEFISAIPTRSAARALAEICFRLAAMGLRLTSRTPRAQLSDELLALLRAPLSIPVESRREALQALSAQQFTAHYTTATSPENPVLLKALSSFTAVVFDCLSGPLAFPQLFALCYLRRACQLQGLLSACVTPTARIANALRRHGETQRIVALFDLSTQTGRHECMRLLTLPPPPNT